MKKAILVSGVCVIGLVAFSGIVHAQGAVINQEGCYCGRHPWPPVAYEVKGSGSYLERAETLAQMDYWNRYANIFDPCLESGTGAPNNGINEVSTFITAANAWSSYGVNFDSNDYGIAIFFPLSSFGVFNECKDFSAINCGNFTESDVLLNANFAGGWTTDPADFSKALVQTTALHEVGHSWGAHHVFTLPAKSNSYSCMNYMFDYGGRYVTRMDANTIRDAYSNQERTVTDFGVLPLSYGNNKYAESYATATSPVSAGGSITVGPITVQNCGTSSSTGVKVSFYLSTDTVITSSDSLIGSLSWNTDPWFPVNSEWSDSWLFPSGVPNVGQGWYYVGAIVTNFGSEDPVEQNNRCLFVESGANGPTKLRRVWVTNGFPQGNATPVPTPKPTAVPDCPCTSWCDDNYVELSVSPSSISSGGTLTLNYDCSFSDVSYYNVPVNVYLALIKDPVITDDTSSTGQALAGGTVYMWEKGLRSNYIWRGRLGEPTWSWVKFPGTISTSGALNIQLTAPPGTYVWATAFVYAATGQFLRPGLEVENSNLFNIQ